MATILNGTTNNQSLTISLAGLANNGIAISNAVNNSTTRYSSADLQVTIKTGIGTIANGSVCVMFLKSSDGGVTFDDADESNAMILLSFNANADNTSYTISSDSRRNGGQLAEFFKIAILNETGAAFDANPSNFSVKFIGKRITTIP